MRTALTAAAALAALCVPASAAAGTAQVARGFYPPSTGCKTMCEYLYVTYDAAPGEVNDVRFGGGEIRDTGSPVTPGPGCTRVDDNAATCSGGSFVRLATGDGDDSITVASAGSVTLRGGEGDDTLLGGDGNDFLYGESGTDTLRGGAGTDSLYDGDDTGTANADMLDGGDGEDLVNYDRRTASVTVTLGGSLPAGGEPGEGDSLPGVENADGGSGDDVLRASHAPAIFFGFEGDDRLVGGSSDDLLIGGAGADRAAGAGGADEIDGNAGADRLSGGAGKDVVEGGAGGDRIRGGAGRDILGGGPGGDTLFARDRTRDRVRGGPGRDRARVDRRDRVRLVERLF